MAAISPELRPIFCEALELGSEEERRAYLDRACQGDADLRARIDALLLAHHDLGEFLEQPVPPPSVTLDAPGPFEAPGAIIGPYKLMDQIGEGGFGMVFVAEQEWPVRRKVALKVIKPGMDTRAGRRPLRGRASGAGPDGPSEHCAGDRRRHDRSGRPYFVMELVRGIPITDYCDKPASVCASGWNYSSSLPGRAARPSEGHHSPRHQALECSGHPQDGKPVAKVIDFGVAKATAPAADRQDDFHAVRRR